MNITHIGVLPPEKSISHYCLHLAKELAKLVDMEYYSFKHLTPPSVSHLISEEKDEKPIHIPNVEIYFNIALYNPFSWILAAIKAKGKIIHIQHWSWYTGLFCILFLPIVKLRDKKIVITVHNITPHVSKKYIILMDKMLNKIIFPFADHFIVHNLRNKKRLMELYLIHGDCISVATHGILKFDSFKYISKKQAQKYLKLPQNKKIILFFGYLWPYKGLDVMIKAMPSIIDKIENILLLIAGSPRNDWYRYEKLIEKHNISEYVVKRLGYITDQEVIYYFSAADISVFPYKPPFDTHGGAAALALPFHKPILVTDIGGLTEYVCDERAISPPDNIKLLSQNIIRVLSDEQLYKKLSHDSEFLLKKLSWDKIAEKIVQVYNSLIS